MFRFLLIISKTSGHQESLDLQEEDIHGEDIQVVNCAENVPQVLEQPEAYKICEGCESLLSVERATCPSCYSYRFDTDREKIVLYAKSLANRLQAAISEEDTFSA